MIKYSITCEDIKNFNLKKIKREWVEIILAIPKNRRVLQNQLPKDNLFRGTKGKIVHPEVKKARSSEKKTFMPHDNTLDFGI